MTENSRMDTTDGPAEVDRRAADTAASDGRASVAILILTVVLIVFLITRIV